jgi:hypothetical protein
VPSFSSVELYSLVHRIEAEKTRPSRKRSACDMLSEPTDMSSPASTQSDLPNDLGVSFYALMTNSPPNLGSF